MSGVVPLLAACRLSPGASPARDRCFGEAVDESVVVIDLDAREIDVGYKFHASAPRISSPHRRRCCGALRVIGDIDGEGVVVCDMFAQLVSSVLDGHRACRGVRDLDMKRFVKGDPFRGELAETQAFAEFVVRAVEPDADDSAVDAGAGGLAEQLRDRDEATIECAAAVALPGASSDDAASPGWASLVGDAAARSEAEATVASPLDDLRKKIQAASATDAQTPAERYRRDALATLGRYQECLGGDPALGGVLAVAELQFLTLPRFVRRRRTDAQMAWALLRALGLLRHLLAKRLTPSEAAWRALLLAAGQVRATTTDAAVREFARNVAQALFREMQAFSIAIGRRRLRCGPSPWRATKRAGT